MVETWNETDKELTDKLIGGLDKYNNIFMMASDNRSPLYAAPYRTDPFLRRAPT